MESCRVSGYEYEFHAIDGPHVAGWNEHFPAAMRFVWKGWPDPVKPNPSAPRVRDVIGAGGRWELATQGFRDARGPACSATGEVFFIDTPSNRIHRITLDGKVEVFAPDAAGASALSFGPNGVLYAISASTGRLPACVLVAQASSLCPRSTGFQPVSRSTGFPPVSRSTGFQPVSRSTGFQPVSP